MNEKKQIEEMAEDLDDAIEKIDVAIEDNVDVYSTAHNLYSAGYRNYGKFAADCIIGKDIGYDIIKALTKKRSDTIKEFAGRLEEEVVNLSTYGSSSGEYQSDVIDTIRDLAKEYGAEVEK